MVAETLPWLDNVISAVVDDEPPVIDSPVLKVPTTSLKDNIFLSASNDTTTPVEVVVVSSIILSNSCPSWTILFTKFSKTMFPLLKLSSSISLSPRVPVVACSNNKSSSIAESSKTTLSSESSNCVKVISPVINKLLSTSCLSSLPCIISLSSVLKNSIGASPLIFFLLVNSVFSKVNIPSSNPRSVLIVLSSSLNKLDGLKSSSCNLKSSTKVGSKIILSVATLVIVSPTVKLPDKLLICICCCGLNVGDASYLKPVLVTLVPLIEPMVELSPYTVALDPVLDVTTIVGNDLYPTPKLVIAISVMSFKFELVAGSITMTDSSSFTILPSSCLSCSKLNPPLITLTFPENPVPSVLSFVTVKLSPTVYPDPPFSTTTFVTVPCPTFDIWTFAPAPPFWFEIGICCASV